MSKRVKRIIMVSFYATSLLGILSILFFVGSLFSQTNAQAQTNAPAETPKGESLSNRALDPGRPNAFLAIAISMGLGCLGAGYAVGKVGSAAIGSITEKPETFGRVILFVGLAEGIAIYGLVIAIIILGRL